MTRDSDNKNELDDVQQRMQQEFGARRAREGEADPVPAIPPPPLQGEAQPIPPPQQVVRLQLPRGDVRAAWVLLALNLGVYLISGGLSLLVTGDFLALFSPDGRVLQLMGWKDNALIAEGQYWRLLTAMFLHGNLVHLFFNSYALFALGPEAERIYGTGRFLALYFVAGLLGSLASYAFSPFPSVGASGAIFGLIGGLAVFYYLGREVLGQYGRAALQNMVFVIVINLFIGFSGAGIDNYAHMGGLVGGVLVGWLLAPRFSVDMRLYPPVLLRRFLPWGWLGVTAALLVLGAGVFIIQPPIR